MLKYTILTLFPKLFENFVAESIIKNSINKKLIQIEIIDFREFSNEKRKQVDEYQYGGGDGMVLMIEPIVKAIKKYKTKDSKVILLSPQGKIFTQKISEKLSNDKHIIFVCGRYEGVDERINDYVDEVISIGEYVLNGGEIPAMVLIETISRNIKGVIKDGSLKNESFQDKLLDYPIYTKPIEFEKKKVPEVLLSGNHKLIAEFRRKQQIIKTNNYKKQNKTL
jgi:tRNA (guanine37-N1)-methyltransferase